MRSFASVLLLFGLEAGGESPAEEDAISEVLHFLARCIAWDQSPKFQELLMTPIGDLVCGIVSGQVPRTLEQLSQAMSLVSGIVRFLLRSPAAGSPEVITVTQAAHAAILEQLKLQDVPDNVKVAAVTSVGVLLTAPGVLQHLPEGSLELVMGILQSRLRVDSTREASLVAATRVARKISIAALFREESAVWKITPGTQAERPDETTAAFAAPKHRSRYGLRRRGKAGAAAAKKKEEQEQKEEEVKEAPLPYLLSFLRKTDKLLRHRTAAFLLAVVRESPTVDNLGGLPDGGALKILEMAVEELDGEDMQLNHLLLDLLSHLAFRLRGDNSFVQKVGSCLL